MKKKTLLFLGINFLCGFFLGFAQGGDLLIQQYNRGPQLDSNYSKWSFRLGPQLNRINADLGTTTPTFTFGGLVEIEYRFSKTVGLVSGAQFTPISYNYIEAGSLAIDRLKYISYPLMLRLQPTYKLSFGLGIIYQDYLSGQKELGEKDTELTTYYTTGIFKNSFGMIGQLSYHLNSRFNIFGNYRWVKRTSPPIQVQTNNTIGFQLGVSYMFLKSKQRP